MLREYLTEEELAESVGTYYDVGLDWIRAEGTACEFRRADGSLIAKLVPGVIGQDQCNLAVANYTAAGKQISTNRGAAAGAPGRRALNKYSRGSAAQTGIIGYFDSANSKAPCRLTRFSREHFAEYTAGLPFICAIDRAFAAACPEARERQYAAVPDAFRIENTAFSTVTVNYNFRTSLHKDSGDYRSGFGTLCICSEGAAAEGGYVLFPRYHLAIKVRTGDFLAMDVHEWHCTSAFESAAGYRLAFICYLRERIQKCEEINRRLLTFNGSSDDNPVPWKTEDMIAGIIPNGQKELGADGRSWVLQDENYRLTYKFKRYVLFDKKNAKTIHNLIPAWEWTRQRDP